MAPMRKRYVVLMRESVPGRIELAELGEMPVENLKACAQVAQQEGFHLMFEFKGKKPSIADIQARIKSGKGVSSMKNMARLWTLTEDF